MVRIGVTGHRILAELDKIEKGIDLALQRVEKAFPGDGLELLSSLAEGADRLVAERLLEREGARLLAVLPLDRDDYATDFATAESRRRFFDLLGFAAEVIQLPSQPRRNAAYEAAGLYVLDHVDILLAVWDGQGAQGQGGTGGIVEKARLRGMPLAWVHAGNRKPGTTEPTSLGPVQGMVTFERFP